MAYNKTTWVNDVTDVDATNMNHIEDGIEEVDQRVDNTNEFIIKKIVELLEVGSAPITCVEGDKYFNTTTNKIYTATATDTWGTAGEDAQRNAIYYVVPTKKIYAYNGTTLEIIGDVGLLNVLNSHSNSISDVYSCNYVNGIVESGSNANGKYIKYIDGTMICTKEISTTIGNWESWGTLFEGYISGGNFPQEFIETPIMNITNIGTGGAMVESVESISKSDFGKIYFARPTTQASTIVKVDIIAIGRWK